MMFLCSNSVANKRLYKSYEQCDSVPICKLDFVAVQNAIILDFKLQAGSRKLRGRTRGLDAASRKGVA